MSAGITVGAVIEDFRVEALVAEGGMASVYLATDGRSGERVALKVLAPELAANSQFRRRFEREAGYTSRVTHPGIVTIRRFGESGGHLFVAMEFVDGSDLKQVLAAEGPLGAGRAVEILRPIAAALDAIHAAGLQHRDVKPANILIEADRGDQRPSRCVLTDFGLAKDPTKDSASLTAAGDFVGSFFYVAPEQVLGAETTGAADVYSLGCVLYECLTGSPPYPGSNMEELLRAHIEDPPPLVTARRPDLAAAIDDVIRRALAKLPSERYPSCTALIDAAAAAMPDGRAGAGELTLVATLLVTAGPADAQRLQIDGELEFGRAAAGAGSLCQDPELSRRHAKISRRGGDYVIEDLGSTNGTEVNGRRIADAVPLREGDAIALGDSRLVVERIAGAADASDGASPAIPPPLTLALTIDFASRRATLELPGANHAWADGAWGPNRP